MTTFNEMRLLPSLLHTISELNLSKPTEIQERAIPILMSGWSLVGIAETGSGKTLSYVLPILHALKTEENNGNKVTNDRQPRAIVITPTRELGEQVSKVFKSFTHTTRLRVRTVLGGTKLDVAKNNIQDSFEVLVATPGRIVKLLKRNLLNFSDVKIVVFDEADQMLDDGFLPDANYILNACPEGHQQALFTATLNPDVQSLIKERFADAETIKSEGSHKVVPTLKTLNKLVVDGKRVPLLSKVLSEKTTGGTLIFTNTRAQCDTLYSEMKALNQKCAIYRGEMDKVERRRNLKDFRDGKIQYLISTDLASRGIDIEHIGRVINYHMPKSMDNYIHRVGRTARAGRSGTVINFITERDQEIVDQLDSIKATPKVARPRSS